MLSNQGFDLWADGYDKSVGLSDEANTYPFAGYKAVLGRIFQEVTQRKKPDVLDIGFGTGTLTTRLYQRGCEIWGQDFSKEMLRIAAEKMPKARLFRGDFSEGLVPQLARMRYDFIIATYSLHHLTDEQKVSLLHTLCGCLKPGGKILIGDVAFETRAALEECRAAAGAEWDEDEIYFVADELRESFARLRFEQISACAGVIEIAD